VKTAPASSVRGRALAARNWRWAVFSAVGLLLVLVPFLGLPPFVVSSMTQILIYAMFAMSLDLILGYAGLPSLGHAAFFGTGAYAAGIVAINLGNELALTLLMASAAALVSGLLVGALAVRTHGIYFLMLTLALSQIFYAIAFKWTWLTGGANGLAGIPRPKLLGISLDTGGAYYLAVLAAFAVTALVLRTVVQSPFGHTLVGIRENESRMEALGYDTWRYKWAAFGLASTLAGVAGAFLAGYNGFVAPTDVQWTTSGVVLIMAIIGGAGTLIGPALGAALVLLLETWVAGIPVIGERWLMVMGLVFMAFVIVGGGGMVGLARRLSRSGSSL
jgi:branched-chain amino acid transport system permease protein